jgi:hypothetical protein
VQGGAAQTVTWSVTGNTFTTTTINANGLLSINANETAPTLTVTATSTEDATKYGIATVTVESLTGIAETLQITTNLYPNPFAGTLHLTGAEGCTLHVITAGGTMVHTQKVVNPDETIGLEQLPAGVYFFRLEKDGKMKTVKAIKN